MFNLKDGQNQTIMFFKVLGKYCPQLLIHTKSLIVAANSMFTPAVWGIIWELV